MYFVLCIDLCRIRKAIKDIPVVVVTNTLTVNEVNQRPEYRKSVKSIQHSDDFKRLLLFLRE